MWVYGSRTTLYGIATVAGGMVPTSASIKELWQYIVDSGCAEDENTVRVPVDGSLLVLAFDNNDVGPPHQVVSTNYRYISA